MEQSDGGRFDADRASIERARRAPLFNVPPIVVLLIGALIANHVAIAALPAKAQYWIGHFGSVSPQLLLAGPAANGGALQTFAPLVTHIFLHADWSHLLLNSVWLLAFGAPIAFRLGGGRRLVDAPSGIFLLFFMMSGVAGALTFVAINPSLATRLIGASGGVSGLLGALVRSMFHGRYAAANVRQSFARLTDSRVIIFSTVILGMNLLVGLFGGLLAASGANIAWEAHMGGYLFGLLTFPAFAALVRRP